MASLNKVLLMGNLTRNPELRYTGSGAAVCGLNLAINRSFKTASGEMRDEVCYIDVTVWGKQGESSNNYLTKGSPVFIEGVLRQESWTDKATGQNRYKHSVSADRVQFLSSPQRGAGGFSDNPASYGQQGHAPQQQYQQPTVQPSYQQSSAAPQTAPAPQPTPVQSSPATAQSAPSFQQPAPQPAAAPQAAPAPSFEPPPMPEFNTEAEDDIPF